MILTPLTCFLAVCLIVVCTSGTGAGATKRNIIGVSLGMTLAAAVKTLKEKGCEPIQVGGTTAKTGTAMPNIQCRLPNGDELAVFFTLVLVDNPLWIVEYMFDSKLLPSEMQAAVEQQFGFHFPGPRGEGLASARIEDNLFILLRPIITGSGTYRYDLELRDVELRAADDEAHKRKLENDNPPPKF